MNNFNSSVGKWIRALFFSAVIISAPLVMQAQKTPKVKTSFSYTALSQMAPDGKAYTKSWRQKVTT